ncbi:MAG: DUF6474 family protein [Nakamurella sp.]
MALRRKSSKKTSSKSTSSNKNKSGSTAAERTAATTGSKSAALVASLSDPKTLRRLLLAAKVVGPVVAATAMKTSTGVRGALDERRAAKLGVPVEDVAEYRGPTGTVNARITGLQKSIAELRARRGSDQKVSRFTDSTSARLGELSAAATATLSMPAGTQRTAVRAISGDLDQLDAELMTFLVGPPL